MSSFPCCHPSGRVLAIALVGLLLVAACARPTDRPRDGAEPIAPGARAGRLQPEPPPTLAPAANLVTTPTPWPTTAAPPPAASPASSPGIYPIISNIQPTPGSSLPPGEIVIGARVTGSSNLVDVRAVVDGEPFQPPLGTSPSRSLVFSFVRQLADGPHEVRVEARDERGQAGAYRWQFTVGPRPPPPTIARPPAPTMADPLPTFTVPRLATPLPRATAAPSPAGR